MRAYVEDVNIHLAEAGLILPQSHLVEQAVEHDTACADRLVVLQAGKMRRLRIVLGPKSRPSMMRATVVLVLTLAISD